MNIEELEFDGAWIVNPDIFADDRGFFFESFSLKLFEANGLPCAFVQDGQSYNKFKNTFRGLHYQEKPREQQLCVRVVCGAVYDYIVDIRSNSPTYGKWKKTILSAENKKIIVFSEGFAHGFLTIEDNTTVLYKMSEFYDRCTERFISYRDPFINLDIANADNLIISNRDRNAGFLLHT